MRCHSSSAICGAKGGQEDDEGLQNVAAGALLLCQFADGYHEGRYAGVVGEHFDVFRHLLDEFVERLEAVLAGGGVANGELSVLGEVEVPCLAQEAEAAVDTVGVPRLALVDGAEEHLVEAQRVGAVLLDDFVGVDDVEHRLRHLFDGPSTDVFVVLEDKFCRGVFGAPGAEGVAVEHVVLYDVDVDVDGGHVILVFQAVGDERVAVFDAVDEVGASLYHALVDEFLEGLFAARHADVVEELVPEAAVDEVSGGVFRAADIEVYVLPVGVDVGVDEGVFVVGVHIAQVVGR